MRAQRRPNSDYRNREHLLMSEVQTLLAIAAESSRYPARDYALILMTFRHGLRASEVAMLRWPDVDLSQQQIYIKRVKGSISGTHPLQPDELEAIQALWQETIPEIFVNERGKSFLVSAKRPGRAETAPGISRIIERMGRRANLGIKVHAHMLRHACGYWLAEKGYPTRDIQAYLGHRNIQNTVRYTAANPARFAKFQWR